MSSPSRASRFSKLIVFIFVILFAGIAVLQLHWFTTNPWMSIRLAPAFQMARGLSIYPTATEGPYAATLYGFVNPLFYTPLSWISNVDWAVRVGGIWTIFWTVGIGFWLLRRDLVQKQKKGLLHGPEKSFLLALFLLSTWAISSLRYSLLEIHADGPAHLFVLLTCLALLRYHETPQARWLVLAGLACGTAPWAKQLTVFSLVGPVLWLWCLRGWKATFLFCAASVASGLVWLAIGCGLFGAKTLIFNLLTVPAAQPWLLRSFGTLVPVTSAGGKLNALAVLLTREVVWDYGPIILLLIAVAVVLFKKKQLGASFFQSYPTFSLLLLTAFCAFPSLALGLVKEGGDVNSASFFTYPAILALFTSATVFIPAWRQQGYLRPVVTISLGSLAILSACGAGMRMLRWHWPSHDALQQYMRSHPGELYCPLDPLVHLLEDKTFAPAVDIIYSLDLAGHKVTPQQFRAELPFFTTVKYVVYHPAAVESKYVAEFFPEHSVHTNVRELPLLPVDAKAAPELVP